MNHQHIKKIVIFGGGTTGWLTAAYVTNNLRLPVEVLLIEDSAAGPIGVGEGTQPYTARFLYECGIPPAVWMKASNASFKLGVELVGWNNDPYFVDNDTYTTHSIGKDLYSFDYFISRPPTDFFDWLPSYQLGKENKCSKLGEQFDFNFNLPEGNYGAVHFSAYDIIKTIKDLILDKISYVDAKIVNVLQDAQGITGLVSEQGQTYKGDLYLDCTGFSSVLINKTLNVPFISYNDWLLCDRAVAIPTQYKDPKQECFPYTRATTMSAGWRWTIPVFNRTGNGYVYSSKYISDDEAEQELREAIGEFTAPANRLKMRCGKQSTIAYKNVCAIGLSAGFVEPLEATGITFTTTVIRNLVNVLNERGNFWNNNVANSIDSTFQQMVTEILAFVWAHYHFSSRNDTPFWKDIRSQQISDLPKDAQFFLNMYYPTPGRFMFYNPSSMFNTAHWFSVIHAGNGYKNIKHTLSPDAEKYAKYFLDSQQSRIDLAKEVFPNQHEYLTKWYSTNNPGSHTR